MFCYKEELSELIPLLGDSTGEVVSWRSRKLDHLLKKSKDFHLTSSCALRRTEILLRREITTALREK